MGVPDGFRAPIADIVDALVRGDFASLDHDGRSGRVGADASHRRVPARFSLVTFPNARPGELSHRYAWDATVTAGENSALGLGRLLNLDRLAGRFNRWIGATAIADKAATGYGAPGEATTAHDPSAVVGVLGEIERQYGASGLRSQDEELPPLNLEPLRNDEARAKRDQ